MDKKNIKTRKGLVVIESASLEDANEVIKLRDVIINEVDFFFIEEDEETFDLEDEKNYIEDKYLSEYEIFLKATYKGKIIGTLDFSVDTENDGEKLGEFGVAVIKKYNRLGIATEMLNIVFDWCQKKKIRKVKLEVDTDNHKAIALYEKLGFISVKVIRNHMKMPNGSKKDALLMFKMGL